MWSILCVCACMCVGVFVDAIYVFVYSIIVQDLLARSILINSPELICSLRYEFIDVCLINSHLQSTDLLLQCDGIQFVSTRELFQFLPLTAIDLPLLNQLFNQFAQPHTICREIFTKAHSTQHTYTDTYGIETIIEVDCCRCPLYVDLPNSKKLPIKLSQIFNQHNECALDTALQHIHFVCRFTTREYTYPV